MTKVHRTNEQKLALIDGFEAADDPTLWLAGQGINRGWFYKMRKAEERTLRKTVAGSALATVPHTPKPAPAPVHGMLLADALQAMRVKHDLYGQFLDELQQLAATGSLLRR